MTGREPGKLQEIASLVLAVAALWMMLPEHQRRLILMRTASRLQRAFGAVAKREGHAGMGAELGGRMGEAARQYSVTLWLSVQRDRFGRALEAMRP